MKELIIAAVSFVTLACIAASKSPESEQGDKKERKVPDAFTRATGGLLPDKRNAVGHVAIIDAQKRVDGAFLQKRAAKLEDTIEVAVAYSAAKVPFSPENLDVMLASATGSVSVVLAEGDGLLATPLLSLPEKKCVIVNVSELAKDGPTKERLQDRVAKELSRAVCFAFVIPYCNAPGGVMDPIFSVKDLDKVLVDNIQVAQMPHISRSAKQHFRMKTFLLSTYRDACQAGWAPAPVNDCQRAIWKEVHELPSAPIKIEK